MTLFQEFRLWSRRAPLGERVTATFGAAVALAVICWLLVPATSHSSFGASGNQSGLAAGNGSGQTSGSTASSLAGSGSTGGSGNAGGVGGTGGAGSGAAGTGGAVTGAGGQRCTPGSDQGLTANQMNIAVVLIDTAGENGAVGLPSTSVQQGYFQDVINSVNATGGVACRKIVAQYYSPDVLDESSLQQACLQIEQSKPFFVIDAGGFAAFPSLAACFPANQLPFLSQLTLAQSVEAKYYPYWFSTTSVAEGLYRNTVFALKQMGFFAPANGFTKLGIVYRDCEPQYLPEFEGYLQQVGVPSSEVVAFDTGCTQSEVTPPNELEQAILTFKQNNVHNVTFVDGLQAWNTWSTIAQQQGFDPKYGFPDEGEVAESSGAGAFNWQNLNGAIAITPYRYGEETTPGMTPTAGTQACNAIMAKYGQPPVWQQSDGIGGVICNSIWFLQTAADHAPVLQRNALAAGIEAAGSIDFSYAGGPGNYTGHDVTTGGEYWRPIVASASCSCWHVINPNFQPSF